MSDHKISWLNIPGYKGETYNPIVGCSKCSPGCQNCYAERMACRLAAMECNAYCLVQDSRGWNGRTAFVESQLEKPLHWKSPRVIFVCSMGDLFHESVPFEWVDRIFDKAVLTPQHKYLLLTKRPDRMAAYHISRKEYGIAENVGIGVTVCNQAEADAKIPVLLSIPAAMRFVSIEPMLGVVDLDKQLWQTIPMSEIPGWALNDGCSQGVKPRKPGLDWVIVGGESGHNARPIHPDWVRSIQRQCADAGVPFLFKQWGEYAPLDNVDDVTRFHFHSRYGGGKCSPELIRYFRPSPWNELVPVGHGCTENGYRTMYRVGRTVAGHLLDGKEYHEYPKWFRGEK